MRVNGVSILAIVIIATAVVLLTMCLMLRKSPGRNVCVVFVLAILCSGIIMWSHSSMFMYGVVWLGFAVVIFGTSMKASISHTPNGPIFSLGTWIFLVLTILCLFGIHRIVCSHIGGLVVKKRGWYMNYVFFNSEFLVFAGILVRFAYICSIILSPNISMMYSTPRKRNLCIVALVCSICYVPCTILADSTGCMYDNGNSAVVGEVALDGGICEADGTRKALEVTYTTSAADMWYQKGLMMGEKNNYGQAIKYILEAKKAYDGVVVTGSDKNGLINILLDLSYYYIKAKQYQSALIMANKVLRLGVDYRPQSKSIALNNKGAALDSLGKITTGKGYYENALDLDYSFDTANSNLDYTNELIEAVARMNQYQMTAITDVDHFSPYDNIKKQHATKYLFDLATKIFKKTVDEKIICKFSDLNKADTNTKSVIIHACQLGLTAETKGRFAPNANMTNEEFVTELGKIIYGTQKEYYSKAQEEGLLENLDADDYLKKDDFINRGDAAVLLYRAYLTSSNYMD